MSGNSDNNFALNAQLQALLQQQQQQQQQQGAPLGQQFQLPQNAPLPQQMQNVPPQFFQQLQQLQRMQPQGQPPAQQQQPFPQFNHGQQQPWNVGGDAALQSMLNGQMSYGSGPGQPSQQHVQPGQQAFPQNFPQQQQQQRGQMPFGTPRPPQQQAQQVPQWMGGGQNSAQQAGSGANGGQSQQPFNPFLMQMAQQGQQQQQGPGQMPYGAGVAGPSNYAAQGFAGQNFPQTGPSGGMPPQQYRQQQQMQANQAAPSLGPSFQNGQDFDAAAFLNALNANASTSNVGPSTSGSESVGSAMNSAQLLQQFGINPGGFPPQHSGMDPSEQARRAGAMGSAHQNSMQSPQMGAPPFAAANTPDAAARARASRKKSETHGPHLQQSTQGLPSGSLQRPSSRASQGQQPGAAASPTPSAFQTPAQAHASIPLASPARAFAQIQQRSRSQTRSPSLSGQAENIMAQGAMPRPFPGPGAKMNQGPGLSQSQQRTWTPSLSTQQQQQVLAQALAITKAKIAQGQASGQPARNQTPAHILMQMGYVFVKAASLPDSTGAGIPGGAGGQGPGAILRIDEAKAIGALGNAAQGQGGPQAQQGSPPPQHLEQMQQAGQARQPPTDPSHAQEFQPQAPGRPFPPHTHGPPTAAGHPTHSMPMSSGMASSQNAPHMSQAPPPGMSNGIPLQRPSPMLPSRSEDRSRSQPGSGQNPSTYAAGTPIKAQTPLSRQGSSSAIASTSQQGGKPFPSGRPHGDASGAHQQERAPRPPTSEERHGAHAVSKAPEHLPPVHGGRLPAKTKRGYDVSPEYNTRFTPLPPSDMLAPDGSHYLLSDMWKPLKPEEEEDMLSIMRRDHEYAHTMGSQSMRNNSEVIRHAKRLQPIGHLHWWERGLDENTGDRRFQDFQVVLPAEKRNQRAAQGLRSALFNGMTPRKMQNERREAARFDDDLVPIRIEIDHEGWKLRDTFTWPAPETFKTEMIDRFSTAICDDIGLPVLSFVQAIRESIVSQVADHNSAEALRPARQKSSLGRERRQGKLSPEDADWWRRWRRKVASFDRGDAESDLTADPCAEDTFKAAEVAQISEAELRIQIKLDITVGAMSLVDQFEWDISDEASSAEQFATTFAADLGLSGEFKTAIAHSIREQVDAYVRSLVLVGYSFDGREVIDDELRASLLPHVNEVARHDVDVDAYTPKLIQLSEAEIIQLEKEREREARRKRRQTRGRRGVNLPDREPLKTTRTPAVHGLQTGTQGPDGFSVNALDSHGGLGREAATSTRGAGGISTRRAAAIVANASIAHAAANERGTPTPGPEVSLSGPDGRVPDKEVAKKRKLDSYAAHFEYPGGLGNVDDEDDEERDRGPKFTMTEDENPTRGPEPRAAELGSIPTSTKHAQSILQNGVGDGSVPGTPQPTLAHRTEENVQVSNWHGGLWYCSNCGVPGLMDASRRKGPLGEKTLCGICGKYYHRHRKGRPAQYTRNPHHHVAALRARGIFVDFAVLQEVEKQQAAAESAEKATEQGSALEVPASAASVLTHKTSASSPVTAVQPETPLADAVAVNAAPNPVSLGAAGEANVAAPAVESQTETRDDPPGPHVETTNEDASRVKEEERQSPGQDAGQARSALSNQDATYTTGVKPEPTVPSRGDSPELPFEQVGSPDDSDSNSSSSAPPSPKLAPSVEASAHTAVPTASPRLASPTKSLTPAAVPVTPQGAGSPPIALSTSARPTSNAVPPAWLKQAYDALCARFPLDRFEVFSKRQKSAGEPPTWTTEWRLRCIDCPGKIYVPGPGETLTNFEIHLKNKVHRSNVQKAVASSGRKSNAAQ